MHPQIEVESHHFQDSNQDLVALTHYSRICQFPSTWGWEERNVEGKLEFWICCEWLEQLQLRAPRYTTSPPGWVSCREGFQSQWLVLPAAFWKEAEMKIWTRCHKTFLGCLAEGGRADVSRIYGEWVLRAAWCRSPCLLRLLAQGRHPGRTEVHAMIVSHPHRDDLLTSIRLVGNPCDIGHLDLRSSRNSTSLYSYSTTSSARWEVRAIEQRRSKDSRVKLFVRTVRKAWGVKTAQKRRQTSRFAISSSLVKAAHPTISWRISVGNLSMLL